MTVITDIANLISDFFMRTSTNARVMQVIIIFALALLLLFVFDRIIERLTPKVAKRADTITTSDNVLRIRRLETFVGVGITIVRALVVVGAIFTVWHVSNPGTQPIALIGVGTVVIVLCSATLVPFLRDITYGFIMIVEKWYGVGDHVVAEPFMGSGGVVEKVTLRSTKLRSVNGEAIWLHHQHIMGVRVTSAASHPLIMETFVNDPKLGRKVVEDAFKIIPNSSTTVPQPLTISEVKKIDENIWRITAVCAVTPFREWVIDDFAIKVIKKTDKLTGQDPVIVHGPIVYYADATAEKRYRRSVTVRHRDRIGTTKKPRISDKPQV
ncbi:MAG TPA: mechanosensitive ion channel domain-containing protein [Candidatus Saccharimonadales bacterium]|nr:mechanosensitive ion channel domain-containing protein [Candidatus Saccharimonadales bacterium]